MFKRIHSNRDPGKTVLSELRKEFAVYISQIRRVGFAIVKAHPRTTFAIMLVSLISSGVLCFTIERRHEPVKSLPSVPPNFAKINNLPELFRRSFLMKREIDSLSSNKKLSHQDSLTLEDDLDSLSQFNKKFKP
jgi:hypothetical protein